MVYKEAPWTFKGKALYQLQLVKSEEARKYIPDCFKMVELFGYTLGGFYLARYDDSPVGAFDELVAMAGLVWNPPTSCAWAARVYVNNREARDHGVHHVGLPSRLATFSMSHTRDGSALPSAASAASSTSGGWWRPFAGAAGGKAGGGTQHGTGDKAERQVLELRNVDGGRGRALGVPVVRLVLPAEGRSVGPRITMALPSFSGATPEVPGLLKYACDLHTNIGLVAPLALHAPAPGKGEEGSAECLAAVLSGRPLITLEFANMEMRVEEPEELLLAAPAVVGKQWAAPQAAATASVTAALGWGAGRH